MNTALKDIFGLMYIDEDKEVTFSDKTFEEQKDAVEAARTALDDGETKVFVIKIMPIMELEQRIVETLLNVTELKPRKSKKNKLEKVEEDVLNRKLTL